MAEGQITPILQYLRLHSEEIITEELETQLSRMKNDNEIKQLQTKLFSAINEE